jgi:cellulose synthase/poly-beta-1,6-N-acetylglucosamine synthase-like glycosyltransferase
MNGLSYPFLTNGSGPVYRVFIFFFIFYQYVVLAYFAIIQLIYALLNSLGAREIVRFNREASRGTLDNLLQREAYIPISILVAAYNEELSIVSSVRSLLSLHYPVFEVLVASDGSTDRTVELMIEAFDMVEIDYKYQMFIECQPVHRVYRSRRYENLTMLEKDNGGKADATNAVANMARYPLLCAADADSLLDASAILRIVQQFRLDERVVAAGGTVRPLNDSEIVGGRIVKLKVPKTWAAQMQVIEYNRAFFSGRTGWAALDSLLIISGAFGIFRRDVIVAVGGWAHWTITEDIELVIRIHRYFRQRGEDYKIRFVPDPVCWTEVPSDITSLRRQRNRWHRGLIEVLWVYRHMIFNPRYGRIGWVALPYMLFVEALSPFVEFFGYIFLPLAYLMGILSLEVAWLFLGLSYMLGVWLTLVTMGLENLLYQRYESPRDYIVLIFATLFEMIGYRQLMVWERFIATFQVQSKKGQWGAMKRTGF